MKKQIWIAAGIAGMLFATTPQTDARAEVGLNIRIGERHGPSFVIETWPSSFIYLPDQGFSVATDSQYDIIFYNNLYYVNHGGYWYRSAHNRGPWTIVKDNRLPSRIRGHRWEDIRRSRDSEYRRRHPEMNRDQRNDGRPENRDQRNDGRPENRDQRNDKQAPVNKDQHSDNKGPVNKDQRSDDKNQKDRGDRPDDNNFRTRER